MTSRLHPRLAFATAAILAALSSAAGCLEPAGSERVGYSPRLLQPGEPVPSVEDDEVLKNRVANNAGIGDEVPLRRASVDGRDVRFWDFGSADSSSMEPLWSFRKEGDDGELEPIDHPDLIDSIPGDDNYTPLRELYTVVVTSAYAGERITSFAALEDAVELGLVEEPVRSGHYVDRPVVPRDSRLAARNPDAAEGASKPVEVYYRGHVATMFRIGGDDERLFELGRGRLSTPTAYALRRWNQETELDEAAFKADLDDDGDQDDSGLVLTADAQSPDYAPLWSKVLVSVPADYEFGEVKAAGELFEDHGSGTQARPDTVVDWEDTGELLHLLLVEGDDDEE